MSEKVLQYIKWISFINGWDCDGELPRLLIRSSLFSFSASVWSSISDAYICILDRRLIYRDYDRDRDRDGRGFVDACLPGFDLDFVSERLLYCVIFADFWYPENVCWSEFERISDL